MGPWASDTVKLVCLFRGRDDQFPALEAVSSVLVYSDDKSGATKIMSMDMTAKLYVLGGLSNFFLLLVFNKFYTGAEAWEAMIPTVFSVESQMLIQLWGLVYISTAKHYKDIPYLSCVFFFEKMLYTWWNIRVLMNDSKRNEAVIMVKTQSDVLTGLFMLIFGLHDFLFGLVFAYGAWVGFSHSKKRD